MPLQGYVDVEANFDNIHTVHALQLFVSLEFVVPVQWERELDRQTRVGCHERRSDTVRGTGQPEAGLAVHRLHH